MRQFLNGLRYAFSGFSLIGRPGIRRYVLLPLAINVLLFSAAIAWSMERINAAIDWLLGRWAWLDWIDWLLWPMFAVVVLIAVFFTFGLLANLLGAPFNGLLAAAVERSLTGPAVPVRGEAGGLIGEMRAAAASELGKLVYFVTCAVPLVVLSVVPLLNVAAVPAWFLFGAWMLALEYLEYPLGNHGLQFAEVRARVRDHRWLAFGFGIGVLGLTLVPLLNFVAMPVAVAGAAKLVVEQWPATTPQPA